MVQITGGGEAPQLRRGGIQALQAGLCQQGGQPAAADRAQREAAVSKTPSQIVRPSSQITHLWSLANILGYFNTPTNQISSPFFKPNSELV